MFLFNMFMIAAILLFVFWNMQMAYEPFNDKANINMNDALYKAIDDKRHSMKRLAAKCQYEPYLNECLDYFGTLERQRDAVRATFTTNPGNFSGYQWLNQFISVKYK